LEVFGVFLGCENYRGAQFCSQFVSGQNDLRPQHNRTFRSTTTF
jgi:hypothetical protein